MEIILDGSKIIKEKEIFRDEYNNNGEQEINEPTELGEAIRELNSDVISNDIKMSGIDLRSRLHNIEISSILAVDTLVSFNFLPISCLPFTRQKKRLSVSQGGLGRKEIVSIVAGKRELETSTGSTLMGGMKNMFGGAKK